MILETLKAIAGAIKSSARPDQIVLQYPAGSPGEGTEAGRFVINESGHGSLGYSWVATNREPPKVKARAELVIAHQFLSLESMARHATAEQSIFVHGKPGLAQRVDAMDESAPEGGMTSMVAQRHPTWMRWARGSGQGGIATLSHLGLADLLLDNKEDLADPMIAKMVAQFRAAKSVEYVADLDTGNSVGIKVGWTGGTTTEAAIPREFSANIPAFSGVWNEENTPTHKARFRLRVIPPKSGEDAAPEFSILWVNYLDYELAAAEALFSAVLEKMPDNTVYLGSPSVEHYLPCK